MSGTEEDAKSDGPEKRERPDDEDGEGDDINRKFTYVSLCVVSCTELLTHIQNN